MPIHTKEQWKEKTLEFLKENNDKIISIKDICNIYGLIPIELIEAVEELEREHKIEIVWDEKNKRWLKHKFV